MNENGTLSYLGADDLPSGCVVDAFGVIFAPQDIVDCFLGEYEALFFGQNGSSVEASYRVIQVNFAGEEMFIRFAQYFGELRVARSESILTVNEDSITQFSGMLFGSERIPDESEFTTLTVGDSGRSGLLEMASMDTGLELVERGRYFDVDAQTGITEYEVAGFPDEIIRVSERDFSVLETRAIKPEHAPVEVQTLVRRYDGFLEAPAPIAAMLPTQHVMTTVNNTLSNPLTGKCRAELDLDSENNHSRARLIYDPNDQGGQEAYTEMYDGEFRYYGGPGATGQRFYCDTNFMRNTVGGDRFDMMSAYFWLDDISNFTNHWRSALTHWSPWHSSDNLEVTILDDVSSRCVAGAPHRACVVPGYTVNEMFLSFRNLKDLSILAHEYGHTVHANYGHGIYNPLLVQYHQGFGRPGISEGFAAQFVLNYAFFRHRERSNRPFDNFEILGDGYSTMNPSHGSGGITVAPAWLHGERVHTALAGTNSTYGVYYDPSSAPCSQTRIQNVNAPYSCGSVLPRVYWELAWNKCRVDYRSCVEGEAILTTSSYASNPERPANAAYTSAIQSLGASPTVGDFFNAVSRRYSQFRRSGQISWQEYIRVMAVLNRYCVGWGNRCGFQYRSVGSPLPESFTRKASFGNGDPQHYLRAEHMTASGSVSLLTTPSRSVPGAYYYNFAKYARLGAPGAKVQYEIDLVAGSYSLDFSARVHRSDGRGCVRAQLQRKKDLPFAFVGFFGGGATWDTVSEETVCPSPVGRQDQYSWGWQESVASVKALPGRYRVSLSRMANSSVGDVNAPGHIDVDVLVLNRR